MPPRCKPETDKHSGITTNQPHTPPAVSFSEVPRHILILQTYHISIVYGRCPISGFLLVVTVRDISMTPQGSLNSLQYVVKLDCEPREHQTTTTPPLC